MKNNKTYTVMKDGETIRELKTLAAAKKLADTEEAEVFCEGLCVYAPDPPVSDEDARVETADEETEALATETPVVEPPVVETPVVKAPVIEPLVAKATVMGTATPEKYTLTAKMNIRKAPSLTAAIARIAEKGTVVEVNAVKNDWLCLPDGTYILFGGGKFAAKN